MDAEPNVKAFLSMLAWAEIGPAMLAMPETDNGYRVLVGSTPDNLLLMDDYDGHPLPTDDMAIEYAPGMYSTAAGRYQILNTYWPYYRDMLGLQDFGPDSQDAYALQQMREQDALEPLGNGDIRTAINRVSNIWASLPGNDYGQPTHDMDTLVSVFKDSGGKVS